MKRWLARRLHYLADRLDYDRSFRRSHLSMTLEKNKGWVMREDGKGIPLWFRADEYDRGSDEADRWPW